MALTYRSLLEKLKTLPEDKLDDDVTLYANDEFVPAEQFVYNPEGVENDEDDRLDPGHWYITQRSY
jgi:hypothetical protein